MDADTLAKRIAAGEWVVDLRDRTASAAEHLAGSVGIEIGQQLAISATGQAGGRVTERSDR